MTEYGTFAETLRRMYFLPCRCEDFGLPHVDGCPDPTLRTETPATPTHGTAMACCTHVLASWDEDSKALLYFQLFQAGFRIDAVTTRLKAKGWST